MSLKDCIKKAGKALSKQDKKFLMEELAQGKTDQEALDSLANVIRQEMLEIAKQVERQGGTVLEGSAADRYYAQTAESQLAEDRKWSKWKPGKTSTGKVQGAPQWVNRADNPGAAVGALERKLTARIQEGLVGRFWYEDSTKAIMNIVNGDIIDAEKLIQLIAIYSPQANVQVNTAFAVKAWNQFKRNEPIKVKTGNQDEKATAVLYGNQNMGRRSGEVTTWIDETGKKVKGRKINSFYENLMFDLVKSHPKARALLDLEPETITGLDKAATIDMWMYRAFEFDNEAAADDKGSGSYSFAENMTRRITAKLNMKLQPGEERWTPHQVQAAIWTAMKARYETDWVKTKTNAESLRKGYTIIDEDGKKVRKSDAESVRQHRKIWGKWARSVTPEEATQNANITAASFETFLNQMTETVTWEVMPSTKLGLAINNAPPEVQAQFHRDALRLIVDEEGGDMLAEMLGVPLNYVRLSEGGYEGMVNENYVSHLVPEKGADGFSRDEVRAYARAIQYIFKQDAVPWFRADPRALLSQKARDEQMFRVLRPNGKTAKKFGTLQEAQDFAAEKGEGFTVKGGVYAQATNLTFKEKLSHENIESVLKLLIEAFGSDAGLTVVGPREIAVINFRDDETGVPFMSDEAFLEGLDKIEDSLQELGLEDMADFWSEGEYGYYQNYEADPEGEAVLAQEGISGRPDLQAWIRDRRQAFEQLLEDYSAERIPDRQIEIGQIEYLAQSGYHATGESRTYERFSTEYVGGGKGVGQFNFGWGLYFADTKAVAEMYHKLLSAERQDPLTAFTFNGQSMLEFNDELTDAERTIFAVTMDNYADGLVRGILDLQPGEEFSNELFGNIDEDFWDESYGPWDQGAADTLMSKIDTAEFTPDAGALYQVELAPAENQYLNWDLPVERQDPFIQNALQEATGRPMEYFAGIGFTGGDVYNMLSRKFQSDKEASLALLDVGIRGNKYRDASNQDYGPQSFNYVIFDDRDVEIIDRLLQSGMFYSALERAAKGIQKKGTGQQMLKQLLKASGVKPEEVEWIGLDDYLAGKESITRDEVLEFIQQGGVKVDEVMYGGDPSEAMRPRRNDLAMATVRASEALLNEDILGFDTVPEALQALRRHDDWKDRWEFTRGESIEAIEDFLQVAQDVDDLRNTIRPTRYGGSYTKPGGEDYREIVMTLPENEKNVPQPGGPWVIVDQQNNTISTHDTEAQAIAAREARFDEVEAVNRTAPRAPAPQGEPPIGYTGVIQGLDGDQADTLNEAMAEIIEGEGVELAMLGTEEGDTGYDYGYMSPEGMAPQYEFENLPLWAFEELERRVNDLGLEFTQLEQPQAAFTRDQEILGGQPRILTPQQAEAETGQDADEFGNSMVYLYPSGMVTQKLPDGRFYIMLEREEYIGTREQIEQRAAEWYADEMGAGYFEAQPGIQSRDGLRIIGPPKRPPRQRYHSSHWDDANVFAHVRFDTREINGKKVLFVQEVQSDWHQAGRQRGYESAEAKTKAWRQIQDLDEQMREIYAPAIEAVRHGEPARPTEWVEGEGEDGFPFLEAVVDEGTSVARVSMFPGADGEIQWIGTLEAMEYVNEPTMEEAQAKMNEFLAERGDFGMDPEMELWEQLRGEIGPVWEALSPEDQVRLRGLIEERDTQYVNWEEASETGVPDAPFKKTWPLLVMKRMIRYAAENDFDQIAWSTGAEQARRYPGSDERTAGMIGFYDQMLPNIVKKYVKKMGTEVGMMNLTGEPMPDTPVLDQLVQDFELAPQDERAPTPQDALWEELAPDVGETNNLNEAIDTALEYHASQEFGEEFIVNELTDAINTALGDEWVEMQDVQPLWDNAMEMYGPGQAATDVRDRAIEMIRDPIIEQVVQSRAEFRRDQEALAAPPAPIELDERDLDEYGMNYARGDISAEEFAEYIGVEGQAWEEALDDAYDFNVGDTQERIDQYLSAARTQILALAEQGGPAAAPVPAQPAFPPGSPFTTQFTIDGLQAAYNFYLEDQGLPELSADELMMEDLTDEQSAIIEDFIARWEQAQEREDQAAVGQDIVAAVQRNRGNDHIYWWRDATAQLDTERNVTTIRVPVESDVDGQWMGGTLEAEVQLDIDGNVVEVLDQFVGDWAPDQDDDYADLGVQPGRQAAPADMAHFFDVTDQMRETAMAGQALFQDVDPNTERARYFPNVNDERIIQLTEASDLSSFLHESSHLFLDIQKVWARKYGLNENQKAMLEWLGVSDFDSISVEQHERWAETFEVYLREGKAPSMSLRRAFASFARWLKRIYRTLSDPRLARAELSPEIRDIFDRMLATQDEIDEAMANPGHAMMFKSKEQSGMTDAQWEEYQWRAQRRKDTAEMTLDEKVLAQYRQQKSAEWKREKKPLIEEEKQRLATQREYQLLGDLVVIKDDDGNVVSDNRMDWHKLKAQVGEIPRGKFIGKAVGGGVDPGIYAEAYGYASVKEMYEDINSKPTLNQAADAAAESRMISRYGDILNDGTLEEEVREAMVNEDEAAMLMMELKASRKKEGLMADIAGPSQKINRKFLKSEAEALIQTMTFKEIKPDRYYRQMIKAAQAAARGDSPVMSKIQQLANHYLYKSALKAKQDIEKRRMKIKAVQQRNYSPQQVDQKYIEQMKMVAMMYDMRKKPEERMQYATQVLDWYAGQLTPYDKETGQGNPNADLVNLELLDPNLIAAMEYRMSNDNSLEGFVLKGFGELTAEEIHGVTDMLDHLRYVGGEIMKAGAADKAKIREDGVESIIDNGGKNFRVRPDQPRPFDQPRLVWSSIVSALPSLGNMVRKLDGFKDDGWAFRNILMPINDAISKKFEMTEQMHNMLDQYMGNISTVGLSNSDAVTYKLESGKSREFSSEEIFMMAVYWGTDSSRQAIMDGHELTETDVRKLLDTLTPEQLHLVNAVWKMNEAQWPALQKAAKAMLGTAPPKLQATPFEVNGVQMTGGHMQLMYTGVKIELKDEQQRGMNTSNVVPIRAGSTHKRVGGGGKPVRLQVANIAQSVEEKTHYIAFAEAGRQLRSLVNNDEIQDAIVQKHGEKFYKNFVHSIQGITAAQPAQETNDGFAALSRYMRGSATMMHLAWSVRNTVQQLGAVPIAAREVGEVRFMQASAAMLSRPRDVIQLIETKSKFMQNRGQLVNREAREYLKKVMATSRGAKAWEGFKSMGFIMQTKTDMAIAYPTWYAKYNMGMEKHGDEKRAIIEADTAVAESVGSGADIHLGRIMQSNQNEFIKTLTIFGSWFNAYYQRLYRSSKGGTDYLNPQFLSDGILLPIIVANLTQISIGDWPDEEEEWYEWATRNSLLFLAGTLPLVRDIGSLVQGFTPTSPLSTLIASPVRIWNEVGSWRDDNQSSLKLAADIGRATGQVIKMPGSGNVWRFMDYMDSYYRGEEGDVFNPYQALTEGATKQR